MGLGGDLKQKLWKLGKTQKTHGHVFEVHPEGESDPRPILAMGQFYHEAAAIDPQSGIVYMTEDTAPDAGLYRFIPKVPGQLHAGGNLQMLKVEGHRRLTGTLPLNKPMAFGWVDIEHPEQGHTPGTHDGAGVVNQGLRAGGTAFVALEGCIHHEDSIYFTSKAGGGASAGQVFRLDIARKTVELIFEASEQGSFSGPDNIVISPQGSLIICEDRLGMSTQGQYIAGLDETGSLFAFCQINPALRAAYRGHNLQKTAAKSEWAGACFSADGQWMFVNIYNPGITLAITGPWHKGPI
jgi:secreted PhoX family phosphatase